MLNLSSNEKTIISFLSIALLIGSLVHYYKIKSLDTYQYVPTTVEERAIQSKIIDINTAGEKDLISLKGIGPVFAERIISYRNTNGPFNSKEDIMKVKGIGPKKFDKIKDTITADR